ncbi:hypothetical protein Aple_100450 [Acrocarpospora pleiomorpha]|uniref:NadR/Ttd14 AAA domain-containing protein n=1 Tax=Acrocarpospora pleiomorpha TaxID=90975 RepID=A0A5M3Y1R7_9ACTN|nr:AAA family ATPase [Acrocarpospora pleiomorpha]GES27146.1 hypothetical protein Aple_100450 [Acrocarpospora pleiomorpha]
MRIGVSGAHGTGKTTLVELLCARLDGHTSVEEPYVLLEEDGYDFGFPPSQDDYRAQLQRSLLELSSTATDVVFDRTPLDFLAYLAAHGADAEAETDRAALRNTLASLDLLVLLPITPSTERLLPDPEMPRLRRAVNDELLDLVYDDPLQVIGDVPVVELTCPLGERADVVAAALSV